MPRSFKPIATAHCPCGAKDKDLPEKILPLTNATVIAGKSEVEIFLCKPASEAQAIAWAKRSPFLLTEQGNIFADGKTDGIDLRGVRLCLSPLTTWNRAEAVDKWLLRYAIRELHNRDWNDERSVAFTFTSTFIACNKTVCFVSLYFVSGKMVN